MASCRALFSRIPSILPRSSLSSSSAAIHRISNRCLSSASIDHNDGAIRPRPATDNDDHQTASSYDHHSSSSHSSSSSHHNNTPKSSPVASSSHSSSPSSKHSDLNGLSDTEAVCRLTDGRLKFFSLENHFDYERAVRIRRLYLESLTNKNLSDLPFKNYEYQKIHGQCAENVIGYLPLPIGVAGPVIIDGKQYFIPLATTEGALIASTTRGCKALSAGGGVQTQILRDGMSRAPVLAAPSAAEAAKLKLFLDNNFDKVAEVFNSTSRFARLRSLHCAIAGRYLFVRFECQTGDAMGMNMVGKGTEKVVQWIGEEFPAFKCLSLSGNFCIDKKPSAINWIMGRGKSVVAECVIPAHIVSSVLKTNVDALVELNIAKNLIGSAMAGSVGGYNAHAANLVAAVFLATGQDPAQVVESSNCMTLMEPRLREEGEGLNKKIVKDLYISVTMPSIEVGTVGGGTSLSAQSSMLKLLGVQGATTGDKQSGDNARQLARVVASAVLAGELSLMSALSSGDLIKSHLKLNRKPAAATHAPNGHH